MWRTARTNIARAGHQVPGALARRVPERIAAARWRWWSHDFRAGSPTFRRLQCIRTTRPAGNRWETVALSTPLPYAPADNDAAVAAIANSAGLLGEPHWLRDRHQPPDDGDLIRQRTGITASPKPRYCDPGHQAPHPDRAGGQPATRTPTQSSGIRHRIHRADRLNRARPPA